MAGSNIQPKQAPWYTGGLSASLRPGANQGDVIYLNGSTGDDGNLGRTPAEPVRTFLRALALCTDDCNDTIVVLDYWDQDATFPIDVNKSMISIIGVPGAGAQWPQINPGNFAAFSITAGYVEICNLSIHGGATSGAIELGASVWGIEIHHCSFGETAGCEDGIRGVAPFDPAYLKIWGCRFGQFITRNGVRLDHNATRGMIGVPGLEANVFRMCQDVAIYINNTFAEGGIFDNRIDCGDNIAGRAITLDATCVDHAFIDGNHANFGDTAMGVNPYLDSALAGSNTWGLNWWGVTASMPG